MLASTYKYEIKNISFCSLKYEDSKNEDRSLTYPNLKEKRKQINRVSGLRTIQVPNNPAAHMNDRLKSTCWKNVHNYVSFAVVMCK